MSVCVHRKRKREREREREREKERERERERKRERERERGTLMYNPDIISTVYTIFLRAREWRRMRISASLKAK